MKKRLFLAIKIRNSIGKEIHFPRAELNKTTKQWGLLAGWHLLLLQGEAGPPPGPSALWAPSLPLLGSQHTGTCSCCLGSHDRVQPLLSCCAPPPAWPSALAPQVSPASSGPLLPLLTPFPPAEAFLQFSKTFKTPIRATFSLKTST